jgi:hypothetical protein
MSEPAGQDPWGAATADDAQEHGQARGDRPAPAADYRTGRPVSPAPGSPRPGGRGERYSRPEPRRSQPPPGGDLLTGLQRWLIRSSAKSMKRELSDQVRKSIGPGRADAGDTWGVATTEIPPDLGESPECAWCPICRAARRMRESGPGLGTQLSGVSEAVASAVQDAMSTLDGVLSRTAAAREHERHEHERHDHGRPPEERAPAERAPDEPGDRG